MVKSKSPPSIRIHLSKDDFGDAYDGQWVERLLRVGRGTFKTLLNAEAEYLTDDEIFALVSQCLAEVFVDWNLEGDSGPYPEPLGNAEAFMELGNSDLRLFGWLINRALAPLSELVSTEKN